ncbi:ATP-dependent DNA ligase [Alicyclobacillus macrosporangiidus]|uniref:DNA ligase (ATP) n=1 Tax=Alicyclobacillus macrosporangiidus TaxID=392015 RepID=A0A1I7K6D6_9BACL|nr:RNA ligase family protein [Alicyclobacillus macrosporangiidus]SFU92997.1 bifunctional non-homologous end joining protein LigD [Alicyclobacillus macrosporangiidus]
MKPVTPMEPKAADRPPAGAEWIAQVKWDGVRVLVYRDDGGVRLYNRHRRDRTWHYPELLDAEAYCTASSVILDGEVVALGLDGKPDFHEVMRRDGVRRRERVAALQRAVPVFYMVFDILYCDGAWVTAWPLEQRLALLRRVIRPTAHVRCVDDHADGAELFERTRVLGLEGIVCKRRDAPYRVGEKRGDWLKVKHVHDLNAVIGGYTIGEDGGMGAVLLGVYDRAGRLWYVGHTGSGRLPSAEWRALADVLGPLRVPEAPFFRRPGRSRGAQWVRPDITVRVTYSTWTPGRSLRTPVLQAVLDLPAAACVWPPDAPMPPDGTR